MHDSFQVIHEEAQEHWYTRCPNIVFSLPLTPAEFKYYLYMRSIAGETGCCFQSRKTIAKEIGISERKQQEANRKLRRPFEELGGKSLLRVYQTKKEDGSPGTTQIIIVNIWNENRKQFKEKLVRQKMRGGTAENAGGTAKSAGKEEPYNKNPLEAPYGSIGADAPPRAANEQLKEPEGVKRPPKVPRAPHVQTTDQEHKRLVDEHGEEFVQACYQRLSEWKEDTSRSKWKKCDNRSIRRWVIRAEKEERGQRPRGPAPGHRVDNRNPHTPEHIARMYDERF